MSTTRNHNSDSDPFIIHLDDLETMRRQCANVAEPSVVSYCEMTIAGRKFELVGNASGVRWKPVPPSDERKSGIEVGSHNPDNLPFVFPGPRKIPSKSAIREHWADALVKMKRFASRRDVFKEYVCMACGCSYLPIERAHIVARCRGGSDKPENLHLLCVGCHQESEFMGHDEYWTWFRSFGKVDT